MTRWLLGLVARLVPAHRRDAWLREWRAELAYLSGRGPAEARHLFAALEDAVGMRMRNPGLAGLGRDLRYAGRTLVRQPLFAAVVVVTLALGIGANTTIFSVLHETLLRPLPYRNADELASLEMVFRHGGGDPHPAAASEPEFLDLRNEAHAFRGLVAFSRSGFNLGGLDEPQRVAGARVSPDFLQVLGVTPALGRGFRAEEGRPGGEAVVVVGHGLWQRAFGSDPGAVGTRLLVNGEPYRVVGVLPPEFEFPVGRAQILLPLVLDPADLGGRSSHYLQLLARLEPGSTPEAAQARLDDLLRRWSEAYPDRHDPNLEGHPIRVVNLREATVGDARASLLLAMGAVGLVLLIACANVANLMLVRAEGRRREMALRRALGAHRRDLGQQLLVESLVLGLLGALGGLGLALGGVRLLEAAGGSFLPGLGQASLDAPVLLFTAALGVGTGVAFGLATAFMAGEGKLGVSLARGGRRSTGGGRGSRLRDWLVVAEVGTAVLLVVGAGLLLRSVQQLQAVDPGFEPEGVAVATFSLSSATYPEPGDITAFHRTLDRRLRALPGVQAAGAVRVLPLRDGPAPLESMVLVDRPPEEGEDAFWVTAGYQVVSPGYFRTLGIPLVQGRLPDWSDGPDTRPVAVINQAMARAFWRGEDPLGRRLRLGPEEVGNPVFTIVGVVGDVRQGGLTRSPAPEVYVPRAQASAVYARYGGLGVRFATLVVKGRGDPGSLLAAVRSAVREVDPDLPVVGASTMARVVEEAQGDTRSLGVLLATLSLLALVLGAVGIYGLMAYTVASRSREIGVRIALGAGKGEVLGSVLGKALALAGAGAVMGLGAALLGAGVLESLLYGVGVRDPVAFGAGPLVLLGVAVLAAFLPARKASRVDPVEAMRVE